MRSTTRIIATLITMTTMAFAVTVVAHLGKSDGTPDGHKSLGGSGELKHFTSPDGAKAVSIRIHGSRYGTDEPPNEKFLIYFLSDDRSKILRTEMADYALFEKGDAKWVEIEFHPRFELPAAFWVALDFRAHRTKGVYVSYDTSTGGVDSMTGLPGQPAEPVDFEGDWMIEVTVDTGDQI